MNLELREQIRNSMNLRETNDLLEIWLTNDRAAWTANTFEVINEILKSRGVEIPEQDVPSYEHDEEKIWDAEYEFSEMELKIIDDENPSEFYDPFVVLKISKWTEKAATASIFIVIVLGLTELPKTRDMALSYFPNNQVFIFIASLFAFGILCAGLLFQAVIIFPTARSRKYIENINGNGIQ